MGDLHAPDRAQLEERFTEIATNLLTIYPLAIVFGWFLWAISGTVAGRFLGAVVAALHTLFVLLKAASIVAYEHLGLGDV